MAKQMNARPAAAGKAAASTAPAKHRFIGTNPTKNTSGPSIKTTNVGPEGKPYMVKAPYTNGGKN